MAETHDDRPSRIPWPPLLLASVLVGAAAGHLWIWPGLRVPASAPLVGAGSLLLAGAVALLVWAARQFRTHGTTIRPDRPADALIASDPYRYSRNPIYLADALLLAGAGLVLGWPLLMAGAALFVPLVDRLAIRPEEAHLARRFGESYQRYASSVRRWL